MKSAFLLISMAFAAVAACDRAPSADGIKQWTPNDHGGEQKTTSAQGAQPAQGARVADGGGTFTLVEVTWRNQCASCHGLGGHGDGPQGPMFKAADLSKEEWQSKAKDEEIAAVILNGKGRMPKFELPDEVVKGLVGRVRSFRGK